MAKWIIYSDSFGNDRAKYRESIDGVIVDAYIHDCDGDFVVWGVKHDGVEYASGEIAATGLTMQSEINSWNEAMLTANGYICAIPGHPMALAFPRWLWAKLCLKEIERRATVHLIEKVNKTITDFEARYPDHPFVKHFQSV